MPLPPLDSNNTGRYWVDYTANGRAHTIMFRFPLPIPGPGPGSTFLSDVVNFLEAIAPLMPTDFAVGDARYAPATSNISINTFAPVVTVAGTYTPEASDVPAFISFVGRSVQGYRTRLYLLGAGLDPSDGGADEANYRLTAGENATVDAAVAVLAGSEFVTVDGEGAVWKTYANLGYHAYWQKKVRS